jgi:hypothetical protein
MEMTRKVISRVKRPRAAINDMPHARWCFTGFAIGLASTVIGCMIAIGQGSLHLFLREWVHLQAFFLISIGTWLFLMARSGTLTDRVSRLTSNGSVHLGVVNRSIVRYVIVGSIGLLGTASLIAMGFNAAGALLLFMWIVCAAVCFTAATVTLHTIEILVAIHGLQTEEIKTFHYAPARTPELRKVVSYFSCFTLLTAIGYAFAFVATLKAGWTGEKEYVEAIRLFWPIVYVPLCSLVLVYPHIAVHRLIQREKERTLLSCQQDIDKLLSKYSDLKTEEIDRTNTLAQLFDRITATPDYVVDIGIAVRTVLPLLLNVATLVLRITIGQN